jgi:hypothetical protein
MTNDNRRIDIPSWAIQLNIDVKIRGIIDNLPVSLRRVSLRKLGYEVVVLPNQCNGVAIYLAANVNRYTEQRSRTVEPIIVIDRKRDASLGFCEIYGLTHRGRESPQHHQAQ